MANEDSLGPMGPHVISVEAISDTVYSVEGDNFAAEFRVEVKDGVGQPVPEVVLADVKETGFSLTLPYAATGPYSLLVVNPDGRSSTAQFATPGTNASNSSLRADS